jgi:DNA-binding NtrC family response regulator
MLDCVRTVLHQKQAEAGMGQSKPFHPPTVLVVEDDEDQRYLVGTLFEESGFEVLECENAEEALALMQDKGGEMALVYTDVVLPGRLDGVDLANTVHDELPQVPVIVTSGAGGDRPKRIPENAVFMQKPWRPLDLLIEAERVRARINEPQQREMM